MKSNSTEKLPLDVPLMCPSGHIVYVVDDNCGVREALTELMESFNICVMAFESASKYIAHVRADNAACLILDLHMPGMDGLELQSILGETGGPPIIFISGVGDVPSTVKAMKAGAIDFFTKPINSDRLISAVVSAFAKDQFVRAQQLLLEGLRQRYSRLSRRERDVFPLVVSGLLNKQAAAVLGITEVTLQIHRSQIMRKMAAKSFADLVRQAEVLKVPINIRVMGDLNRAAVPLRAGVSISHDPVGKNHRL